ncbi:MAG: hypothetical protein WC551_07665 [Patescibacteria group bacterium]
MALPPTNIEAVDLYERLTSMPRPHEMVPFPRKDAEGNPMGQIPIWPLKENEILQAEAAATAYTRKLLENTPQPTGGDDFGYREVYNNAMCTEILQRACRKVKVNPETGESTPFLNLPLFLKTADLRNALIHDEIGVLFNEYMLVQRQLGPIANQLSKVECEAWLKRLQEGGERMGLSFFSWAALIDLVSFMVDRITSLQTELSSAGLPHEDIESPTSPTSKSDDSPTPV